MLGLGIALMVGGYGLLYWGTMNMYFGADKGPSFASTFGLKHPLIAEDQPFTDAAQGSSNQTGQPASSNTSPAQVVRNV